VSAHLGLLLTTVFNVGFLLQPHLQIRAKRFKEVVVPPFVDP